MDSPNQNNELEVQRMVLEKSELDVRVESMRSFLGSSKADALPMRAQADLKEQLYFMEGYAWVLQRRIRDSKPQTNI